MAMGNCYYPDRLLAYDASDRCSVRLRAGRERRGRLFRYQEFLLVLGFDRFHSTRLEQSNGGEGVRGGVNAARRRVEFRRDHEQPQGELHSLAQVHLRRPRRSIALLKTQDAANRSRSGSGSGITDRLELSAERIVEEDVRHGWRGRVIKPGEERHHHADALDGHGQIIAKQSRESTNLGGQTKRL